MLESMKGQRRRAEYKAIVAQALESIRIPEAGAAAPEPETAIGDRNQNRLILRTDQLSYESVRDRIVEHLSSLPACTSPDFNSRRFNTIVKSPGRWNREQVFQEMSLYLRETFQKQQGARNARPPASKPTNHSRRQTRRAEYARTQRAWKQNRTTCIRDILKNKRTDFAPPKEIMVPFWERIMTSGSASTPGVATNNDVIVELWDPITTKDVSEALPPTGTAPGPDCLTIEEFRRVPLGIWTRIFNIMMQCGKLPEYLLESRTILIPKKDGAAELGEFRPITVSSAIVRTFHKVLANRMSKHIRLDPRQKAFQPIDGCSENIFLVDFVLKYARQNHNPLLLA